MAWTLIAESDRIETLGEDLVEDFELPEGTPVRIVMELNFPLGYAFSLPGAELIFRPFMPEGVRLIDVHGDGWWRAVVEGEIEGTWVGAILAFIKLHWLAVSLITIGIIWGMAELIKAIRFEANVPGPLENLATIIKWGSIGALGIFGMKLLSDYLAKKK